MEDPVKNMQEAVVVDVCLGAEDNEQIRMGIVLDSCVNENNVIVSADHEIISSSKPHEIKLHVSLTTPPLAKAKPVNSMAKIFLLFAVQASLSVLTISWASGSSSSSTNTSSTEQAKKQLLQVAGGCNMMGYIGCLADILLGQTIEKFAKIAGIIGATATVFGFTAAMGTLLAHNFRAAIGISTLVTMLFLIAVITKEYKYELAREETTICPPLHDRCTRDIQPSNLINKQINN